MSAPVVTIVHCWSSPRSRSTALLYSFESRGDDTVAIDESLYRRWLREKIGASCGNGGGGGGGRLRRGDGAVRRGPPAVLASRRRRQQGRRRRRLVEVGAGEDVFRRARVRCRSVPRDRWGGGEGGGGDGDRGGGGVVFLKQMAKFSHQFDFDDNW